MDNKDSIFSEFIESLYEDKLKFLNGCLYTNKDNFIKQVETIALYIDKIHDNKIKEKVSDFVKEITTNENYITYKQKEQNIINKVNKRKKIQEQSDILIKNFKILLKRNDLKSLEKLYLQNKAIIDKYQHDFTEYWYSLPRNINDDWCTYSCKRILRNRKIKNLVHFTNIDNLLSIFQNGLMPRNTLEQKQIRYCFNDKDRRENKLNCVCLSVEYPNKHLLDMFKSKYNKKYCIIILDAESVLLNNINKKYYVYCNAAREDAIRWLQDETLSSDKYFAAMFTEDNPDSRDFCQYTRTNKQLKDFLPTNPQAEILFQGTIPVSYIKAIYFEDLEDINNFKQSFNENNAFSNIELLHKQDFFLKNRDEIEWEDR